MIQVAETAVSQRLRGPPPWRGGFRIGQAPGDCGGCPAARPTEPDRSPSAASATGDNVASLKPEMTGSPPSGHGLPDKNLAPLSPEVAQAWVGSARRSFSRRRCIRCAMSANCCTRSERLLGANVARPRTRSRPTVDNLVGGGHCGRLDSPQLSASKFGQWRPSVLTSALGHRRPSSSALRRVINGHRGDCSQGTSWTSGIGGTDVYSRTSIQQHVVYRVDVPADAVVVSSQCTRPSTSDTRLAIALRLAGSPLRRRAEHGVARGMANRWRTRLGDVPQPTTA